MAKVVLDTMNEDEGGSKERFYEMMDDLVRHDITHVVLQESGPGGGWPEIEYTGSREALEWMIRTYFDDGTEENDNLEFIED